MVSRHRCGVAAVLVALLAVSELATAPSADSSPSRLVVAVGGWNSVADPSPAVWEIAHLIGGEIQVWALPGGEPDEEIGPYAAVEHDVRAAVLAAIQGGQAVVAIGHSYGATLLLRVLHDLAAHRASLRRVRLFTLDRDNRDYPLPTGHLGRVPPGILSVLNIYETVDGSLVGGELAGAVNVDASLPVDDERRMVRRLVPGHPAAVASLHNYMTRSHAVRRRVLEEFHRGYVGGIWETVAPPGTPPFYWLVDPRPGTPPRFVMRHWIGPGRGTLEYKGSVSHGTLGGRFSLAHLPPPPGCSIRTPAPGPSGRFGGSKTAELMSFAAEGTETDYVVDPDHPGNCSTFVHPYSASFEVTVSPRFRLPRSSS